MKKNKHKNHEKELIEELQGKVFNQYVFYSTVAKKKTSLRHAILNWRKQDIKSNKRTVYGFILVIFT